MTKARNLAIARAAVALGSSLVIVVSCGSGDGKHAENDADGGVAGEPAGGQAATTPGGAPAGGSTPTGPGGAGADRVGGAAGASGQGGGGHSNDAGGAGAAGVTAGGGVAGASDAAGAGDAGEAGGTLGGAGGAGGAISCNARGPLGTFSDDFAQLHAARWAVAQTTSDLYSVDVSQGDVRLSKPQGNPAGLQNVALVLDLASVGGPISGDFDESVSFANASLGSGGTYQVELHALFGNGAYFFAVYDNSSGLNVHVWNGALQGVTTTAKTGGTFRIARSGTNVSAYFDGVVIASSAIASPLTGVNFMLQVQPSTSGPESVTFDDFSLQGACIHGD